MYEEIKEKYKNLEAQLSEQEVINNPPKLKEVSQKHAELKPAIKLIEKLESLNTQIEENEQILQENGEAEIKDMARQELEKLKPEAESLTKQIKEELNPKDPNDKKNVIMEIRAGAGGEESSLFAADLFKMYSRYCEMKGWKINILNSTETEIGGYKEINFEIKGEKVYSFLKYEGGAHRVQRIPETEKQGRVHTSAATVAVLPEAEAVEVEINNQDIRIDTFCASGPGGQSVNTTESAIRVTYLPEDIVVSCQDQKSQQQNREKALQILRSRLLAKKQEEQHQSEKNQRQKQVGSGDRSEKIRTYNFPQDRVTDHRIQQSWHNLEKIMDGEIDEIIKALQEEELKLNDNES